MDKITRDQRALILTLLKQAEYDAQTVTLMHRRLGVADHWQGRAVSEWLDSLSLAEAQRLIGVLKDQVA